eukprot:g12420.t1
MPEVPPISDPKEVKAMMDWLRKGRRNVICPRCRHKFVNPTSNEEPGSCPKCHHSWLAIANTLYDEPD